MIKGQKAELATKLKEKFSRAQVAIFADYKGLKATDADEFRKQVRATNGQVVVLKNNIARQAVKDGSLGEQTKELMDGLAGPIMVAFAFNDPAATAKAVHKFVKDNEAMDLRDSLMGQTRISAAEVEALADLPSREVMLSILIGTMQAPARDFVSVLAAVPRGLVTVLDAIARKKESAG